VKRINIIFMWKQTLTLSLELYILFTFSLVLTVVFSSNNGTRHGVWLLRRKNVHNTLLKPITVPMCN